MGVQRTLTQRHLTAMTRAPLSVVFNRVRAALIVLGPSSPCAPPGSKSGPPISATHRVTTANLPFYQFTYTLTKHGPVCSQTKRNQGAGSG